MANSLRQPVANGRTVQPAELPADLGGLITFRKAYQASKGGRRARVVVAKGALNEAVGQSGGYTVPKGWSEEFFRTFEEQAILWPRATQVPLTTMTALVPLVDATTVTSAGVSPFFGGTSFTWQPLSGTSLPETEPQFRQLGVTAWNLLGKTVISNQLLDDMTDEGEVNLLATLASAAAWSADYTFFQGLGAGSSQPLGMLKCPSAIAVTRAVTGHISQGDVAGMVGQLLPNGWRSAIWCVSPGGAVDLVKVTGYVPNATTPGPDGSMGTLYSRPVFVTEKLNTLGSRGDVLLCDPTMYAVALRQQVVIDVSSQEPTAFAKNQTVFRTWLRLDGKSILSSYVTLTDANGATQTVSDIVVLAA